MTKELIKSTIINIENILKESGTFDNFRSESIPDSEYVIGIVKCSHEVTLWADNGRTVLFCNEDFDCFESDIIPLVDEIFEVIEDKENGIIRCSDCGKKISVNEIAGHYFAGSYCKHCWDTKWKAIEAKETYE